MTSTEVYATVAELKARINKTLTDDDTVLLALLTAASRAIDRHCNHPDGFVSLTTATARIYAGTGRAYQWIDECTSVSLVAVKDSPSDTSYTSWASTDWQEFAGEPERPNFNRTPYHGLMVKPTGDYVIFTSGYYSGRAGFKPDYDADYQYTVPTVQVTAKWGYATTCPEPIREATVTLASRWYKRGEGAWSDTLAGPDFGALIYRQKIDPDVAFMLDMGQFIRPPIG